MWEGSVLLWKGHSAKGGHWKCMEFFWKVVGGDFTLGEQHGTPSPFELLLLEVWWKEKERPAAPTITPATFHPAAATLHPKIHSPLHTPSSSHNPQHARLETKRQPPNAISNFKFFLLLPTAGLLQTKCNFQLHYLRTELYKPTWKKKCRHWR
jgi:hypothetical protein